MNNHVTWYKDELTYLRFKELCEDKAHFGNSYQEWVAGVQSKIDKLATQGIILTKVNINPEDFAEWCRINHHAMNATSRGLFGSLNYP